MAFIKKRMKNLKVPEKLRIYRICMIVLIAFMGVVSVALTMLIDSKVREMTEQNSPSLSYVQKLNTLTSDYRLKQYQYLVASDKKTLDTCEEEMEALGEKIADISNAYSELITTETQQKEFDNAKEKWAFYEEESEEIIALGRSNEDEKAAKLMLGEMYDDYKEFENNLKKLEEHEGNQLEKNTKIAKIVFIFIFAMIIVVVGISVIISSILGKTISDMIIEPVVQIQKAVGSMRIGELSKTDVLVYESEDELGTVTRKLKESMNILYAYVAEICDEVRKMAAGDLTKSGDEITDFLGDFSEIKESLIYILKDFNSTLTEIQDASEHVASNAVEISKASQSLAEGTTEQAGVIEELTATVDTVVSLASDSAKATQNAYEEIRNAADMANVEKKKMAELITEMEHITEISKEIENIITDIEDIASQTNLLSLNASIEAARAGEAGKGFAVVAGQIGKLASDSAQSAVNTRNLINKTLTEIEKGNTIAVSTSESFNQIITNMQNFAQVAQRTTENANTQADALAQIGQGIEQLSGTIQNTAAASEENTAISISLSDKSEHLHELVSKFKLF
mgnify:CR=1 FL=1